MEENKPENNQWRPVQIQTILLPTDLRLESMVAFSTLLLWPSFSMPISRSSTFSRNRIPLNKKIGLRAVELLGVKKSNAERELALIEGHLRAQYPKCRSCFRVGTPFEQSVRQAENIGANLIVMPCHSNGWPDRILHGYVAEGMLRRAPCPVLIAKEPNQTRISPILN